MNDNYWNKRAGEEFERGEIARQEVKQLRSELETTRKVNEKLILLIHKLNKKLKQKN